MSLARKPEPPNTLYYGDNLDILRRYIDDESIDLIYLDPPFNSNADYNVLFAEKDGTQAHAQIKAFKETRRDLCDLGRCGRWVSGDFATSLGLKLLHNGASFS